MQVMVLELRFFSLLSDKNSMEQNSLSFLKHSHDFTDL